MWLLGPRVNVHLINVFPSGIPIKSTLDNSSTVQYAGLIHQLVMKARSTIRDIDPQNDLTFMRVRSKKNEIMIAPGESICWELLLNETLLFQLTWLINASKGSNTLPLAELKPSRQPPSTCLSKRPQPWCPNGSVIRKIQPPFSCYNPQLSIEVVFVSGWLNAGASGGRELQFVALQCRFHLSALQSLLLGNKFPPLGESRAFKWCLLSVYITFHKNCFATCHVNQKWEV